MKSIVHYSKLRVGTGKGCKRPYYNLLTSLVHWQTV